MRQLFAPVFKVVNLAFIAVLFIVIVRTAMYIILRFTSVETAYVEWKYIEPWYFYSLFGTEAYIVATLLIFLWFSSSDP